MAGVHQPELQELGGYLADSLILERRRRRVGVDRHVSNRLQSGSRLFRVRHERRELRQQFGIVALEQRRQGQRPDPGPLVLKQSKQIRRVQVRGGTDGQSRLPCRGPILGKKRRARIRS